MDGVEKQAAGASGGEAVKQQGSTGALKNNLVVPGNLKTSSAGASGMTKEDASAKLQEFDMTSRFGPFMSMTR